MFCACQNRFAQLRDGLRLISSGLVGRNEFEHKTNLRAVCNSVNAPGLASRAELRSADYSVTRSQRGTKKAFAIRKFIFDIPATPKGTARASPNSPCTIRHNANRDRNRD